MKRFIAVALSLAVVLAAGFYLLRPKNDYPANRPGPEIIVAIEEGESGAQIATTLKDKDVIKTRQAFLNVIYSDERSRKIQPGGHRVQTRIPAREALEQLLDPKRRTGVVTFPEGLRTVEVIKRLAQVSIDASQAVKTVKPPMGARTIEGFLFPGQYAFAPDANGEAAVQAMLRRFTQQTQNLEQHSKAIGLSPYQGLIVASLLQGEGDPGDYTKILRVILNRLRIGMPLQLDTTVLYALNESGRIRVTTRDLQVNSPYNTYRNKGLPPTPINNPGKEAIDSLATPAQGDWLYYITVKPGDTRFTRSHDQFLKWKIEFRANYRAGLFG